MKQHLTYRFKLYRSKRNKHLSRLIDVAASIYNHAIALHKRYYRRFKKHLAANRLKKHLTKLKIKRKFKFWNQLNSQAAQDVIERIDRAYDLFFENLKKNSKRRVSMPNFKKREKYKSFTLKQTGYKFLRGNKIKIGKRVYKFFKSRDIKGAVKIVTVKRDSLGDFYLFVVCKVVEKQEVLTVTGHSAGIDFGLKTFLKLSNGDEIHSPEFLKANLKKLRQINREFSHKQKGSANLRKAKLKLVRQHRKIANLRRNFHFEKSRELLKSYDILYFETLNLSAMKKLWGRKVSDLGFADFLSIIKHLAKKFVWKEVCQINLFEPSSKTCSECLFINPDLQLREREWNCSNCGSRHDRDTNAAMNIKRVGASTHVGEEVRLAPASILC